MSYGPNFPNMFRAASKALDTSVRNLSRILLEDVRMTGTRNDDRLDAQDPTCRRLLPLWPDLVVSRARNVHVVDRRQRFQRTDFDMSGWRGVDAFWPVHLGPGLTHPGGSGLMDLRRRATPEPGCISTPLSCIASRASVYRNTRIYGHFCTWRRCR
jgi:hypothetical protein